MTRYAAAGLAALLLAGLPGAAQGAEAAAGAIGIIGTPWATFSVPIYQGISPDSGEGAAPVISREEALALVQKYFKIPEGPGRVDVDLHELPTPVWHITYWIDREYGSQGTGIGEVDAVTGRILSFNLGDIDVRGLKKGPSGELQSEEEARSRAWELIEALYPDKVDSLQLSRSCTVYSPFSQVDAYTFCWTEHYNGIPIIPNAVAVSVDRYTLDYVYFQPAFESNLVIPEAEAVFTADEAFAAFQQAAKPTLRYAKIYPDSRSMIDGKWELRLLYDVEVPDLLDAATGEFAGILETVPSEDGPKQVPAGTAPLRPDSLPLDVASAEQYGREILELPSDMEGWTFSYYEASPDSPSLELYWMGPKGDDVGAVVDRQTGRVIRAYRNFSDSYAADEVPKPTPQEREAAEQEAIRVVQRLYGDLLPDLKEEPAGGLPFYYGGRLYVHFQRYVNGIPYDGEGVYVVVDYRTGEWTDVSVEWSEEVEVPAPEGVISPEKAHQAYFKDLTAELVYYPLPEADVLFPSPEESINLALVYQLSGPDASHPVFGIDAFTGEPITIKTVDAEAVDSQLAGHWAESEIRFLLSHNLIPPDALNPDRPVTREEALSLLIWVYREFEGYWYGRDVAIPYTDVSKEGGFADSVRQALRMGILRPEGPAPVFGGDDEISRAEFALWLVRALELGGLAESSLVTEPTFTDAAGLTPTVRNAAAFLEALGIIPAGGEFRGEEPLTLAEVAASLVRLAEYLQAAP